MRMRCCWKGLSVGALTLLNLMSSAQAQSVFQPSAAALPSLPSAPIANGSVFSPWASAEARTLERSTMTLPSAQQAQPTQQVRPMPQMLQAPQNAALPMPAPPRSQAMPNWQWPEPDEGVAEGRRVNPWRSDAAQERSGMSAARTAAKPEASRAREELDWLESNWQDYLERERQRAESARQREEWLQELRALQQRYPTLP